MISISILYFLFGEGEDDYVYHGLPKPEQEAFRHYLNALNSERDVITSARNEGHMEGWVEGRAEGRAEGVEETARKIAQRRFCPGAGGEGHRFVDS